MLSKFVICSYIVVCLLVIGTHGDNMCGKKCICHKQILECKGLTQQDLLSDTFQNTINTNYKTIRLTDGAITELPKNLLGKCADDSSYRLDNLLNLDLHSNSIKIIHGQSLHCMRNLTRLNLSNNQWNVSTIHTHVFTSLPKLKYLNLSNAFHDQIQGPVHLAHLNTVFLTNDLTKLEVLLLDNNRFSFFGTDSANAICTLSALRRLNLAWNLLPKIAFYHKTCTPFLEHLDLSYNSIITIDDYSHNGLLYGLDYIQKLQSIRNKTVEVNFIGNEFDCDCGLLEFHNWLKRTKVHVVKKTSLICHAGLLFNRSTCITSLQTGEFKCFSTATSTSSNHAVGVLVTMFVLIALILVVAAYLMRDSIWHFVTSFKKLSLAREHLFGYSTVNNENAIDIEI